MDKALEQLVDHITRYLERGVSEDKVNKVMKQNDLEDGVLERAFSIVHARQAQAKAEAEAKAKAEEEEAQRLKEAAAHKKKKQEAKKAAHKTAVRDKHHHDLEAGAEALPQDTAISLHSPPPKPKLKSELKEDDNNDDTDEAEDTDEGNKPAANTNTAASSPDSPTLANKPEQSLTEALLGIQPPAPDAGQVVGQVTYGGYQPPYNPQMSPQTPMLAQPSPYAGTFATAAPVDTDKYPLFQAVNDSFVAARTNVATYASTATIAYVAGAATFVLTALAIGKFFTLPYSILLTTPTKLLISIIGSTALYALWAVVAGAFGLATASRALFDSSQSHKTSVTASLTKSSSRIGRVTLAVAGLAGVALLPLVIVTLMPVIAVGVHGTKSLAYMLPALYLVAFGWAVFVGTRFALVPYIALFERPLPFKKTLDRSKQLLAGSGQWFVAEAIGLVAAVALAPALLLHYRPQAISHPLNIIIDLILLLVVLVANGALVMLYCNRKLFKG